jgi:hypothetical protein
MAMQRQKSFTAHFFGLWGWLALGSLALGGVFVSLAVIGSRNADRLTNEGADATALVTDTRRTSDGEGGTDYTIRYRFTVNGETIEDRQDVSFLFFQSVSEGEKIPVRYWTGDPMVSEVQRGDAASMGLIGKIGTAISAVIALIFARIAWKRAAHATWMARHGVRRQVTVLAHQMTNVEINDIRQWKATWREADGRDGATRMANADRLPAEGSQITILVDPEHRRDSIWEGDLLA